MQSPTIRTAYGVDLHQTSGLRVLGSGLIQVIRRRMCRIQSLETMPSKLPKTNQAARTKLRGEPRDESHHWCLLSRRSCHALPYLIFENSSEESEDEDTCLEKLASVPTAPDPELPEEGFDADAMDDIRAEYGTWRKIVTVAYSSRAVRANVGGVLRYCVCARAHVCVCVCVCIYVCLYACVHTHTHTHTHTRARARAQTRT
jgi:hypothetical protein